MTYRLEMDRGAEKELKALDKPMRTRIEAAIDDLRTEPRPSGCTKLTGHGGWRIRVGTYRILYEIIDQVLVVRVVKVDHRRDIYRRL